jgi:two-component system chemotaxis response regulator CheY
MNATERVRRVAPSVLIVADKAIMRLHSVNLLKRSGFQTLESDGGEAALSLYELARPDAVLLDISLSEDDGLATLRRMLTLHPAARVGVISGRARRELVLEAIKGGAVDFVVKPFPPGRLLQAVRKLVSPPTERQYPRVRTHFPAEIGFDNAVAPAHPCVIEDLSMGGARCRLTGPLPGGDAALGAGVSLRFTLPGGATPITTIGRVARRADAEVLSIAFLQIAEHDRDAIDAYCQRALHQQGNDAGSPANRQS